MQNDREKEIRWVGSAYADLVGFPDEPRRDAGFQLSKVQAALERFIHYRILAPRPGLEPGTTLIPR